MKIDNFEVRKSDYYRSRDFIKEYHYTGGCGSAVMTWGLFHEMTNELLGVIAFQTPISENARSIIFGKGICSCQETHYQNYYGCTEETDEQHTPPPAYSLVTEEHKPKQHVTELHRLAIKPKCPQNTASWLISRGLKRLKEYKPKYRVVISFADTTEGHDGGIYKATNALYYGMTDEATFYRDQDGILRPPRNGGDNISVEQARSRGWEPEKRKAKHRFLYLLPDPYQDKDELVEELEVDIQSYPNNHGD